MPEPLLQVDNLKMYFPVRSGIFLRQAGWVKAVDDVSFNIYPGETLGLVGESGCGKSTIGKSIVRLLKPTGGSIRFNGNNIARLSQRKMRPLRPHIQMVFQDPAESLNQRQSIGQIVAEPFVIHRMGTPAARREWVRGLLDRVGLPDSAIDRFPFEFSGGQRQRIGIARALTLNPSLIILDEPVSALDVSVQSQVLNLLLELQEERKLSYLFIAHDLAVVKHISDRVAVIDLFVPSFREGIKSRRERAEGYVRLPAYPLGLGGILATGPGCQQKGQHHGRKGGTEEGGQLKHKKWQSGSLFIYKW